MDEHRDRASGWQHAKLSGHLNEDRVKALLENDPDSQYDFLIRTCNPTDRIVHAEIGGLHEKDVPGVLGKKTKSKTDLKVFLESGKQINVSIKKSLGGQVYFVRVGLFFMVFERQFNKVIPGDVKRAMQLFWADANDADYIIKEFGDKGDEKTYYLQLKHHSLNANTLMAYDINLYESMLQWFRDNAYELSKLSFSMGAAQDYNEWSDYVWYINTIGENEVDEILYIEDICESALKQSYHETYYGESNGGTTIQLPFGFVQWHQSQMQFHHSYWKVKNLCK